MVNTTFKTEVYEREGNSIIGAEVIVYSGEQEITDIILVNKTDLDDLEERLDNLGVEYVKFSPESDIAGESIETILENVNEDVVINATALNGLQSDRFAKVSHQHTVNDLTNLLNYEISCDKYNIELGETLTVTIRVTKANGASAGARNIIFNNNGALNPVRTNNNGIYTIDITPQQSGMYTFGVSNQKIQVLVTPLKEEWTRIQNYSNDSGHIQRSWTNGSYVFMRVRVPVADLPASTGFTKRATLLGIDDSYLPSVPQAVVCWNHPDAIMQIDTEKNVNVCCINGRLSSAYLNAVFQYPLGSF